MLDNIMCKYGISVLTDILSAMMRPDTEMGDKVFLNLYSTLGIEDAEATLLLTEPEVEELDKFYKDLESRFDDFAIVHRFLNNSEVDNVCNLLNLVKRLNKDDIFIYHLMHEYEKYNFDVIEDEIGSSSLDDATKYEKCFNDLKECFKALNNKRSLEKEYNSKNHFY